MHESGYSDFDDASETSEESNDEVELDVEESGEHVGFSSSDVGQCSTLRGCVIPIDGDQPSLEKVSLHLDTLCLPTALFFSL